MSYFELLEENWPALLKGVEITLVLSGLSLLVGLVAGLLIALLRLTRFRVLKLLGRVYVDVVRGTPILVQLFLIYYGLPQFGFELSPIAAATVALGGNYSAYLAEVYRSGLLAVHRGQWEAGAALGFQGGTLMRRLIMPQAVRIALPGIGNYSLSMLKDSALASTVTVGELLRQGQLIVAATFQSFDIYLTVAVIYLAISIPLSIATHGLERRSSRGYT